MTDTQKSLKGTQTEKNIAKAYASESTAYTRYTFYAQQATKENYFPIAEIFNETAANELHHGKVYFRMLEGGKVDITVDGMDAGVIGQTADNLATAVSEEQGEGVDQYEEAAKVADSEGFPEIASHFRAIATVEKFHENRFRDLEKQVREGTVWKRPVPIKWQCMVCGYIYEGTEPPVKCPGCDHPYQHYKPLE